LNIYKITNIVNGLIYIGQEKKNNPNYLGSGKMVKEAVKIFGRSNFRKEIIESGINTPEELNTSEKFWIKELKSRDPNIGYNLAAGGSIFYMSPEIANKISESLKGKYTDEKSSRYGSKITEEHKKAISIANKGKNKWSVERRKKASERRKGVSFSEATLKKMSSAKKGKKLPETHKIKISECLRGKKFSDETKQKLSIKNRNKTQKNSKVVFVKNLITGEFLEFNNISEASRFFNSTRFRIKENLITGWDIKLRI